MMLALVDISIFAVISNPANDAKKLIIALPTIIFLKLDVNKFIVICGNVSKDNSSMIPTNLIHSTNAIETIISINEFQNFALRPIVIAKSLSNAEYNIFL